MNLIRNAGSRLAEVPPFECWNMLESVEIARVAWNGPRGVAIVPVNFFVADGAIWFRTNPYSTIARESGGQWIAVEVDSVDAPSRAGWSVVVRGTAELFDALDVPEHLAELRVWPEGVRSVFVRVDPVEVTGRRLMPATDEVSPEISP